MRNETEVRHAEDMKTTKPRSLRSKVLATSISVLVVASATAGLTSSRTNAAQPVVYKCVGFETYNDDIARVYVHNDGIQPLTYRVRWYIAFAGSKLLPQATIASDITGYASEDRPDLSGADLVPIAVMAAKVTLSSDRGVIDARALHGRTNPERLPTERQITCERTDNAPDPLRLAPTSDA